MIRWLSDCITSLPVMKEALFHQLEIEVDDKLPLLPLGPVLGPAAKRKASRKLQGRDQKKAWSTLYEHGKATQSLHRKSLDEQRVANHLISNICLSGRVRRRSAVIFLPQAPQHSLLQLRAHLCLISTFSISYCGFYCCLHCKLSPALLDSTLHTDCLKDFKGSKGMTLHIS